MNDSTTPFLPDWTTRQVILATLLVLSVGLAFWLLYHFQFIVFIVFAAVVIGTALLPVATWLQRRGVPDTLAVSLIFLVLLVAVIGFGIALVPLLVEQVTMIAANIPTYYRDLRNTLINSPILIFQELAWHLPAELSTNFFSQSTEDGAAVGSVFERLTSIGLALKSLFITIATLALGFYWTLESRRIVRALLLLAPHHRRDDVRELVEAIQDKVGAFIRGQTILCGVIAALAFVAYMFIGLPYALALALLAGILEAVPYIGPVLGAIPAILVASSLGSSEVIWVLVASLLIQQIENMFLVPRIMDRSVGVNPIITLLALFTLGTLLGVVGALLAIPLAAIVQLLLDRFIFHGPPIDYHAPSGRGPVSVLRYEVQELMKDVRQQIRQNGSDGTEDDSHLEEEIELIAADLDSVLASVEANEGRP